MITSFTGDHEFLSNFHTGHPFHWDAFPWLDMPTGEHAFQAAKAAGLPAMITIPHPASLTMEILNAPTPGEAKRLGRAGPLPPFWDLHKREIMLRVLLAKYQHGSLRDLLVTTGSEVLVEGNSWGDTYWGAVMGPIGRGTDLPCWKAGPQDTAYVLYGHNWLGRLLMMVRETIS